MTIDKNDINYMDNDYDDINDDDSGNVEDKVTKPGVVPSIWVDIPSNLPLSRSANDTLTIYLDFQCVSKLSINITLPTFFQKCEIHIMILWHFNQRGKDSEGSKGLYLEGNHTQLKFKPRTVAKNETTVGSGA